VSGQPTLGARVRRGLRENGLSLVFGALFLAALAGQALSGVAAFNEQQLSTGGEQISLARYLVSSAFAADVAENWQSEYLQFVLYIFATVWLVQHGSTESKQLGEEGTRSDKEQRVGRYAQPDSPSWARLGGWRTGVYSRSLGLLMLVIFVTSWATQSVAGWAAYNADQLSTRQDPVSWLGYLAAPDFWNRTLQNWQSELLAVGSMAIFAVYLRQRGSPESKAVGAPHRETSDAG
jgi:hypothetical protein